MTNYLACSRRASDAELVAILEGAAKPESHAAWCFIEGPTCCKFTEPTQVTSNTNQIAILWQVRLFAENFEVAARRLNFQDEQPWMVRWIGAALALLTDSGWSGPLNLPPAKSSDLLLYGQTNPKGSFQEGRFLLAELQYPGEDWKEKDQAVLATEIYELDDGAIVRWKQITKYVEASKEHDCEK